MASRPLRVYTNEGELIELTDSEISYDFGGDIRSTLQNELLTRMATSLNGATDVIGKLTMTVNTTKAAPWVEIGSYVDTYLGSNVGDTSMKTNTYRFYQYIQASIPVLTASERPLSFDAATNTFRQMTWIEIKDLMLSSMAQVGTWKLKSSYIISDTVPTSGTWTSKFTFSDTDDNNLKSWNLYLKTGDTATVQSASKILTWDTATNTIKEATSAHFDTWFKIYQGLLSSDGIGTYSFGNVVPVTGSWVSLQNGTDVYDKRNTINSNVPYTGVYTRTWAGSYVGGFNKAYVRIWNVFYNSTYTGAFSGNYAGTYNTTYSGNYNRVYSKAYIKAYVRIWTKAYVGAYTRAYAGAYNKSWVSVWARLIGFTHGWARIAGTYTGSIYFTGMVYYIGSVYYGGLTLRLADFAGQVLRQVYDTWGGVFNYVGTHYFQGARYYNGTGYYARSYVLSRSRQPNVVFVRTAAFARVAATYNRTWTGAAYFTGTYTHAWGGTYNTTYGGTYNRGYDRIYNRDYITGYIKGYVGAYTHAYAGVYTGAYSRAFTVTWSAAYNKPYTKMYERAFAGGYNRGYTGIYSRDEVNFVTDSLITSGMHLWYRIG